MADDQNSTTDDGTTTPPPDGGGGDGTPDLGDAGKRALEAERRNARNAAKERDAALAKLKEIEDSNKSELQKALDAKAEAERQRDDLQRTVLRSQVARRHGLEDEDMDFVHGTTEEEIEASAVKLAGRILRPAADDTTDTTATGDQQQTTRPPHTQRPTENLRGGGDPTELPEETDPAKLAALIPRT